LLLPLIINHNLLFSLKRGDPFGMLF